ncbi:MAG: hypothetical protein M3Y33_14925 [Actinomycetota bacterium]|nr:hypothetical protein [Actinomycetota bacterium]
MAEPDVWVAKADGSDVVRAAAIVGVGRDYNGNVTVRLSGGEQATVTLVTEDLPHGAKTPADFHIQLIRVITELSDTSEPAIVRPAHVEPHGWAWRTGPL